MAQTLHDLIKQDKGSGTDSTYFVKSDGAGKFVMAPTTGGASHKDVAVTGTKDGTNKTFAIANAVFANTEQIFINGQLLTPGSSNDYVLTGTALIFQAAMFFPAADDVIRAYGTY